MGKRKNDKVERSSFGDEVEGEKEKRPREGPRKGPRKVPRHVSSSDEEWEVEEEEERASERPRRKLRKIQRDAWISDEVDEDEPDEEAAAAADEEWTPTSIGAEEEMWARGRRRKRKIPLLDFRKGGAWISDDVEEDEEWEAEEGEKRARPRKIRRNAWSDQRRSAAVEKWFDILEAAKKFKKTKGHFPKFSRVDQDETNLYFWLYNYRKGGRNFKQELWELLNEAFGEGWEEQCFRSSIKPSSKPRLGMDEATWDATLKLVIEFKRDSGVFPSAKGKEKEERRLWNWLKNNTNTEHNIYSEERARKLVLALGDRWQKDCFPNTIFVW